MPDARFLGDFRAAVTFLRQLPQSNGKVGTIGYCSGGRQAYIAACNVEIQAAVDCYGGRVVATPKSSTPGRPVAPIDMTPNLNVRCSASSGRTTPIPIRSRWRRSRRR